LGFAFMGSVVANGSRKFGTKFPNNFSRRSVLRHETVPGVF
jgi:hypothetical protein